jgi:hypothetical protein
MFLCASTLQLHWEGCIGARDKGQMPYLQCYNCNTTQEVCAMNHICQLYKSLWPVNTGYSLIRLGSALDGGYLLPNCLDTLDACVSPGTCNDILLETDLARIYGLRSILCDPSHSAPPGLHPLLSFDQIRLSSRDAHDSVTLDTWLDRYGLLHASALML